MSRQDHITETTDLRSASSTAKKPYRKPEFRFERVFETRALTCGKQSATQAQCTHNTMNS